MRDPDTGKLLPFARPTIEDDDLASVAEALSSGWLSFGPRVREFERRVGERLQGRHVVATNSGTAALHLAALVAGLGPSDEMLVPSLGYPPSAGAAVLVGAKPVFVDVDPRTLCLDVADVRARITPRTRAVMALHFAGRPVDLRALRALCDEHGLLLLEDAAHAFGAQSDGVPIGCHGDLVCFSFQSTKPLTTGEGGALVTPDGAKAALAREYRGCGLQHDAQDGAMRYRAVRPGYKYVMNDVQAALGLSQLAKVDRFRARRREIALRYDERLRHLADALHLPSVDERMGDEHAWHLYVVQIRPESGLTRAGFVAGLADRSVGTGMHYPPLHLQPLHETQPVPELPVTERVWTRLVSLPLFGGMTDGDVEAVCDAVTSVLERS